MGMLWFGRTLGLGLVLGAGATFACVYPTERSEELRVVMDPIPELLRGAYLVDPRFSGGGSSDLAFEFQLGDGIGTANKRFRFHVEYEFQRIDRKVGSSDVPIQMSLARAGIAFGF